MIKDFVKCVIFLILSEVTSSSTTNVCPLNFGEPKLFPLGKAPINLQIPVWRWVELLSRPAREGGTA